MAKPANDLTTAQASAVNARGNVVVVAGAGTGKTKTLIARCLDVLGFGDSGANPAETSIENLLVVTFTEAAAAELKSRLRTALLERMHAGDNSHRLQEQLQQLDTAWIGTLHACCLRIIRDNFQTLGIDPQSVVPDEAGSRQLQAEVFNKTLNADLALASGSRFRNLLALWFAGDSRNLEAAVQLLRQHAATHPDLEAWLAQQRSRWNDDAPALQQELLGLASQRLFTLEASAFTDAVSGHPDGTKTWELARKAASLGQFTDAIGHAMTLLDLKIGRTKLLPEDLRKRVRAQTGQLSALLDTVAFAQECSDARSFLHPLLDLVAEFHAAYQAQKRDLAWVDFGDQEQFAIQLLGRPESPTPLALALRRKFHFVFVDEYQDINQAQDTIITLLSREAAQGNRFLVGDLKQSIYRFRGSDPGIFQQYQNQWQQESYGTRVLLNDNFRSHESILGFVNLLFSRLMTEEFGGIPYASEASLNFGNASGRTALSTSADARSEPRTTIHLIPQPDEIEPGEFAADATQSTPDEIQRDALEARLAARLARQLVNEAYPVWNEELKAFEPCQYRHCTILHRSGKSVAASFQLEFQRESIPLEPPQSAFFSCPEIRDLMALLEVLDNAAQDTPLAALLLSPMGGFTMQDLAEVRGQLLRDNFYLALRQYAQMRRGDPSGGRIDQFLSRLAGWREAARETPISRLIEQILEETQYVNLLRLQPEGAAAAHRVEGFLSLAERFNALESQGLQPFLAHLQEQQNAGTSIDQPTPEIGNAIRLMTIHASKGLEFPVVILAGIGRRFMPPRSEHNLLLSQRFGICPKLRLNGGSLYNSQLYHAGKFLEAEESEREEMRLLYVALTRARDRLLLVGCDPNKASPSYLKWLKAHVGETETSQFHQWLKVDRASLESAANAQSTCVAIQPGSATDLEQLTRIEAKVIWNYPAGFTREISAKESVTGLRRRWQEDSSESRVVNIPRFELPAPLTPAARGEASAAEIGLANHTLIEHLDLEGLASGITVSGQLAQMIGVGIIPEKLGPHIHLAGLDAFFASPIGRQVVQERKRVEREHPFTARFTADELNRIHPDPARPSNLEEFIIVQGVADLAILGPEAITIVDFKTDHVDANNFAEKVAAYSGQLRLYGSALQRIHGLPATRLHLFFLRPGRGVNVEMNPA